MTFCRIFFFSLIICLVVSISHAQAEKTITFSTHVREGTKPFLLLNMLMTEAFNRLGMQFVLKTYPAKRALEMANCGITDGEGLRIAGLDEEYSNLIQLPVALRSVQNFAYSQQALNIPNGWEDLSEVRAVILRGSVLVTRMANKYCKKVYSVNTHEQQLRFLISNRADILIESPQVIGPFLEREEFKDAGVQRLVPALSSISLYPYLNKKNKDLAGPFAEVLREIMADGTYERFVKSLDNP